MSPLGNIHAQVTRTCGLTKFKRMFWEKYSRKRCLHNWGTFRVAGSNWSKLTGQPVSLGPYPLQHLTLVTPLTLWVWLTGMLPDTNLGLNCCHQWSVVTVSLTLIVSLLAVLSCKWATSWDGPGERNVPFCKYEPFGGLVNLRLGILLQHKTVYGSCDRRSVLVIH